MAEDTSSKKPIIVVLLLVFGLGGLCITGVLAAIAIPAFMKYIKKSKASEPAGITRKVADWAKMEWEMNCAMPQPLPRHTDPASCCGGEKCTPDARPAKAWGEAGAPLPSDPTYFAYTTERIDAQTYLVRGMADFSCGGPMHTVEVTVTGRKNGRDCVAEDTPPVTSNEFE